MTGTPGRATTRITVRLTPRSGRDEVTSFEGEVLHARVTAPPVGGAANEALVAMLAKRLGLPRSAVMIARGHGSRLKVIEIDGMDRAEALARLLPATEPG